MNFSNKLMLNDWNWRTPITNDVPTNASLVSTHVATQTKRRALKEKALREIRSMHEMGEIKRAHEFLVDKFSVQKLRESHETIQRLTSRVQDLQERMDDLLEWLWIISRNRVDLQWTNITRSQSTSKDSKSTFHAKLRQTLATWHMESFWTTGKRFLAVHVLRSSHHKLLIKESSIYDTKCCRWGSHVHQHRGTCGKRGWTNREHNSNADICKKAADHSCGYSTEFYGWTAKIAGIGTSVW